MSLKIRISKISAAFSLLTLVSFACSLGRAGTRVAFLEVYDHYGRLVQYEPNSRFGHTALEISGKWLQAYPGEGVKLIDLSELKRRGKITAIIELKTTIPFSEIENFLGLPFDFHYDWNSPEMYCTELLAKILKIEPQPMQFNWKIWPKEYRPLEGLPGLSPDKLFMALKTQTLDL